MKKYNITVNGNAYEVEVDEVGGTPSVVFTAPVASAPAPQAQEPPSVASQRATPNPQFAKQSAPSDGAATVEAPMPGTVLDVLKKGGDPVADGEVVLILEAMKMENEIVASQAGTIDTVAVAKGAAVNAGDLLFSIK